ncbi:MAG: OmpA family protein [Bacteriovoracaceae bacterium]|nr:OmpA family protein [Bacteriovoracaceae bacterium]
MKQYRKKMKLQRNPLEEFTDVDTQGSWAISYGDMVTLLLVFFIIFSWVNVGEKQKGLDADLIANLSPVDAPLHKVEDFVIEEVLEKSKSMDAEKVLSSLKLDESKGADVFKVGNRIIIDFKQVSFFKSGKTDIILKAEKELKLFAQRYIPYAGSYILSVRAYTDSSPVKVGAFRFKDNLELSSLRAISAMRVLQKAGIPLSRMRLGGYGELLQTTKDIKSVQTGSLKYDNQMALARKVVLVIEPDTEERL